MAYGDEPNYTDPTDEDNWEPEDSWQKPLPPTDPDGEWVYGNIMAYPIEDLHRKYFMLDKDVLTNENSILRYQSDAIERAFVQFGLTKDEYAKAYHTDINRNNTSAISTGKRTR